MRSILVIFILLMAGCATPQEPASLEEQNEVPIEPEYSPNLWLLNGPRPVSATQVSSGAEPSILTDINGEFIWIGDTSGGYYSRDNGTSWGVLPDFVTPSVLGDGWALAQDDEGVMYAMGLTGPELEIARSLDGTTWDYTSPFAQVSVVTDRPWLAARGDGEVAVIYFDGILGATGLYEACARSLDGGETWLDVSRFAVAGTPQAGNLVHTAAGDLAYVEDGGRLYTYPDGVCLYGPESKQVGSNLGANNMIQLDAHEDGSIFVGSSVSGSREVELYGQKSGDQKRLIVSPPELQSNTFVSVSTFEDYVAIGWYGSETPGNPDVTGYQGSFNVYLAIIKDFWTNPQVEHWRITDEPNHVGEICMGGVGCTSGDRDLLDYWMLDFDIWGGVHLAYGHDGTSNNAVVRYAQVSVDQIHERFGVSSPAESAPPAAKPLPQARFTASTENLQVRFDASKSTGDGLSYAWKFGDGETGSGKTVSHDYPDAGTYTIALTLTDIRGKTDVESSSVTVQEGRSNQAPTAAFSFTHEAVGTPVQFVDETVDDGNIIRWNWDFGDGATAAESMPIHAYEAAGNYDVTLVVEDDEGATAVATGVIKISAAGPASASPPTEQTPAIPILLLSLVLLGIVISRRRWN